MTSSATKVVGNYELVERIGSGSFSTVFRGRRKPGSAAANNELEVVAVKAIHLNRLNPKLKQAMFDEVEILGNLQHAHIVTLLSTLATANTLYLFLEYCGGGDLHHYIRKHKHLKLAVTQHFLRQLASGLEFLWRHNLIHRDLKPHNLLLTSTAANSALKIADFGFARHLGEAKMAQTMCGSPLYMCPELLAHQNYDSKCDLWSTGVILFEMMTGHAPYEGANPEELLMNIQRTELRIPAHADTSPDAVDLLRRLLRRKPAERISYQEFFESRFIAVDSASPSATTAAVGGEFGDEDGGSDDGGADEDSGFFGNAPTSTNTTAAVDDAWEFVEAQRPLKPVAPPPPKVPTPPREMKPLPKLVLSKSATKRKHASGRAGTFAVEVSKRAVFLARMSEQIVDLYEELALKPQNLQLAVSTQQAMSAALVVEAMRLLTLAAAAAEDALEASAALPKKAGASTSLSTSPATTTAAAGAAAAQSNVFLVQQIRQWLAACEEKASVLLDLPANQKEEFTNPKVVMYRVALGLGSRCAGRELLLPADKLTRQTSPEMKREIGMIVEDYSLGLMLLQLLTTNITLKQDDRGQILGFITLFCNRLESLL